MLLCTTFLSQCKKKVQFILLKIWGKNHILGHRLYLKNFPKVNETVYKDIVIIGGGVAGLSAARALEKRGLTNYILLELEDNVGGNSSASENKFTKYPLGAHYLPLPNIENQKLIDLLYEATIIKGFDSENYPIFDDLSLVFDPMERIYYKNSWQEGLLAKGDNNSQKLTALFFKKMNQYRYEKDIEGHYYFNVPLDECATDNKYDFLDSITMKQWLKNENLECPELEEYINYCCRDDYGIGYEYVSAWAGIHYFASRKYNSTKTKEDVVLTWAEGNHRLVQFLKTYSESKTKSNSIAFNISNINNSPKVTYYDANLNKSIEIECKKIIVATPQYINKFLIDNRNITSFEYAPWIVATLTLKPFELDDNFPLAWENIIYQGVGLGFVNDKHQSLSQEQLPHIWTYYHSLNTNNNKKARKMLLEKPNTYWENLIIQDLKIAYPQIEQFIESIEIYKIGHGMISPTVGFIKGSIRKNAKKSIEDTIYFCHSDLSGISLFEEAFYRGNLVGETIKL